jgi:Fe-Mn family superoxide dismutase
MKRLIDHIGATASDSSAIERRTLLVSAATGLATGLFAASSPVEAQQQRRHRPTPKSLTFAQAHEPKPLPYKAGALNGLSERLIESHWSNNYGGSVRTLNEVKKRLGDALAASDTPPFVYDDLKREHLMRTGSVVLHELYFENLGGNGVADADARAFLASGFGDFDRWETEFRRIANGLGGGSGWVVLGYNRHFRTIENYWLADHLHFPASTEPLLVMDMYEHSYQMDFGAAAARYVDAFFKNINWERVLARVDTLGG